MYDNSWNQLYVMPNIQAKIDAEKLQKKKERERVIKIEEQQAKLHGYNYSPSNITAGLYDEVIRVDECHNPHHQKASASENHVQVSGVSFFEKMPKSYSAEGLIARGLKYIYTSLI